MVISNNLSVVVLYKFCVVNVIATCCIGAIFGSNAFTVSCMTVCMGGLWWIG